MKKPSYSSMIVPRPLGAFTPLLISLSLLVVGAARAQDTASAPAKEEDVLKLGEYVVTGGVTPRSKLESPLAITTIDRGKLEEMAPRSTAEMLKVIPGIYTESTGGEVLNNVTVRGIAVSGAYTYIVLQEDGLPVFSESTLRYGAADQWTRVSSFVSNVEGLRGGSSNIFATNAPLALINLISREGGTATQGEATFTASDYGTLKSDVWMSGPASKNTTFAVGGWYRVDDGARDPGFPGANKGGQFAGNIKHTFENGRGYVKFSAKVFDDHNLFELPMPLQNANSPQSVPFGPDMKKSPTQASADERRLAISSSPLGLITYDLADGVHSRYAYAGAELEYELAPGIKLQDRVRYTDANRSIDYLTSGLATPWQAIANAQAAKDATQFAAARDALGNYQFRLTYPGQNNAVAAATPAAAALLGNGYGDRKTWNHAAGPLTDIQNDLRVINSFNNSNTTATAGLYYSFITNKMTRQFNELLTDVSPAWRRVDITFVDATTGAVIGPGTLNGISQVGTNYRNDTSEEREVSPYVEVEHKLGALSLDAGLRHHQVRETSTMEGVANVNINTAATGNNPALKNAQFGNGNFTQPGLDITDNAWTAGANYTFTHRFAAFGRYSRGARFISLTDLLENAHSNLLGPKGNPTNHTKQYELGVKYSTGSLGIFLTAYRVELSDIFFNQTVVDPITGALSTSATTKANTSNGVELESIWAPLPGLSLGVNGTLASTKWTDHALTTQTLFNGTRVVIDENGRIPPRTPRVVGTFTASYRFPEMALGTFSINGSYQYTGKRYADLANSDPSPLKGFGEAVLGVALTTKNRFTLRLSVNNVFNNDGLSEGDPRTGQNILDPTVSTFNARPLLPRTITGSASYRF